MNLKDLKIDGVSYKKLFSENEDLKQIQEENIFKYLKENRNLFLLRETLDEVPMEITYLNRKVINRIDNHNPLRLIEGCLNIRNPREVRKVLKT